jgi:hypothetical protein
MSAYYIAATIYEGCGHQHRTRQAATRCLPRIDDTHGKRPRVHKIKKVQKAVTNNE